jgi:hypothetical protein
MVYKQVNFDNPITEMDYMNQVLMKIVIKISKQMIIVLMKLLFKTIKLIIIIMIYFKNILNKENNNKIKSEDSFRNQVKLNICSIKANKYKKDNKYKEDSQFLFKIQNTVKIEYHNRVKISHCV